MMAPKRDFEDPSVWPLAAGAVICAVILSAAASFTPARGQDEAGDPSGPGAELYFQQGCYGCHGFDGKGRMMPLVVETSGILQDEAIFIAFLRMRADLNPILPSSRMPNYPESSLSDDDARAIYAHILAIQSPDPSVDEIPVLRSILQDAASE